jgi:Zn-dependent protease
MILRIRKTYIILNPFVILSILFILIRNGTTKCLLCIGALAIHETGHIIMTYILGEEISILKILPFGLSCTLKNQSKITTNKMQKILIAGPAVNIITAGIVLKWTPQFATINIIIALINLLPIGELDGKRILNIIMNH